MIWFFILQMVKQKAEKNGADQLDEKLVEEKGPLD